MLIVIKLTNYSQFNKQIAFIVNKISTSDKNFIFYGEGIRKKFMEGAIPSYTITLSAYLRILSVFELAYEVTEFLAKQRSWDGFHVR